MYMSKHSVKKMNAKKKKQSHEKDRDSIFWKRLPPWIRITMMPVIIFALIFLIMYVLCGYDVQTVIASLDSISVLTGTFTTILAFSTWLSLQRLSHRKIEGPPVAAEDAAILIIDIGINIKQNVIKYCTDKENLQDVISGNGFQKPQVFDTINGKIGSYGFSIEQPDSSQRVLYVSRQTPFDSSELAMLASNIYGVFGIIDSALRENGVGTLHIFYGGMAAIPFFIGELFSNRYDAYVYHYQTSKMDEGTKKAGKSYYYCGQMNHLL